MSERVTAAHGGLTPFFLAPLRREGWVHSCFDRVVNVAFPLPQGPPRLLTLTGPGLPALPDGLRLPLDDFSLLRRLPVGTKAVWTGDGLRLPGMAVRLDAAACALAPFPLPPITAERARRFLSLYGRLSLQNGLDALPEGSRRAALAGLSDFARALATGSGDEKKWPIGLGKGTTPAGDDAMVGVLSALGRGSAPLGPSLLDRTTDISARYLRCAQEGYFSAPVLAVWQRLTPQSLIGLSAVGATSGADMLLGMAAACEWYLNKEEKNHASQANH